MFPWPREPTAYDDDWEDQPAQGWFYKWVAGVIIPIAILAVGIGALMTRDVVAGRGLRLVGVNAIAFGCAAVSLAIFLHCRYYWGNVRDQAWYAVLGKILSLLGFITALSVLIVRVGVLGVK